MTTRRTHDNAGITRAADALTIQLLSGRDLLPVAANNHPPLCSNPRAATIHAEMKCGRCKPWHHLLTLAQCYLEDGVPPCEVLAVFRQAVIEVEVLCVTDFSRRVDHPLPVLIRAESARETRLEGRVNVAQERVVIAPDDPTALAGFLSVVPRYKAALTDLETSASRQLAKVRNHPRKDTMRLVRA